MKDPHTFTFIGPKGRGKTQSVLGFIGFIKFDSIIISSLVLS